jgi:hypothetical protein
VVSNWIATFLEPAVQLDFLDGEVEEICVVVNRNCYDRCMVIIEDGRDSNIEGLPLLGPVIKEHN